MGLASARYIRLSSQVVLSSTPLPPAASTRLAKEAKLNGPKCRGSRDSFRVYRTMLSVVSAFQRDPWHHNWLGTTAILALRS